MRPVPFVSLNRWEHIGDITFQTNSQLRLPTQGGVLPSDRFYYGLVLTLEGRLTMPSSGGPSAFFADGPYQLIERIVVEGYHRVRGQQERFIDIRGSDLVNINNYFLRITPQELPVNWNFSANATNDFRLHYFLPFVPYGVSPFEQFNYLLDAPNYDSLQLIVQTGDVASICSGTNLPTLSAFGSTTGSPRIRVEGLFALAGQGRFIGSLPGRVWRYTQEVVGSPLDTTATDVRLVEIPRGFYIRFAYLKVGQRASVTAGNNAYSTLEDGRLSNIRIYRGLNNPIRYYPYFSHIRFENALSNSQWTPTGVAIIDFAKNGLLGESLNLRPVVAGPSGTTDTFIAADVNGAANRGLVVVWEEIRALPAVYRR